MLSTDAGSGANGVGLNAQVPLTNLTTHEALINNGEVAIPITIHLHSNTGNGWTYSGTVANTGDETTAWGNSDLKVFKVNSLAECTVEAGQASTVTTNTVEGSYAGPTSGSMYEYWCAYAELVQTPTDGSYTNVGTVTGTSGGVAVTASDTWTTELLRVFDPATEPRIDLNASMLVTPGVLCVDVVEP